MSAAYCKAVFQDYLQTYCDVRHRRGSTLDAAIRYALLSEGKRVRPLLLLLITEAFGGELQVALRPALAIELLHTWSLVHDDLPCMDNDDQRRGQASVHKKFDSTTALLAGDALLSDAFYLLHTEMITVTAEKLLPADTRVQLATLCARAIGSRGMVYGQHRDFYAQQPTCAELCAIQRAKTGWLMAAACGAAAVIAAPEHVMSCVRLGHHIGLMFQISDDLHDGEQQGASWLAVTTTAQAHASRAQQMARIRRRLRQLRLDDTHVAPYIESLAQHSS